MDPNPYEPPRVPESKKRAVTKRSIGFVAILLLTPIAVAIAFGASCTATNAFLSTSLFGQNYGLVALVGWSIFLIPPALVLFGMVWWIRSHLQGRPANSKIPPERN